MAMAHGLHPMLSQKADFMANRPRNAMMELAKGYTNVIALGRGDPDLPTPPHIIEGAHQAALNGATHYTPINGIPELRRAIVAKYERQFGLTYNEASEVLVTTGGQEGINVMMMALLNAGDEVLVCNPSYSSYDLAIYLAGGTAVTVPLRPDAGFQLDPADLEAAITPRTKAMVIITPNNPTGTIFPRATLERVAEIAIKHDVLVIFDEIYEQIVFAPNEHFNIATIPGMQERTIILNGFSKLYSMTGWRVGYLLAPARIMKGLEVIKHTYTICTPAPSQWAALAAITGDQTCVTEMLATYSARRQWLIEGLREVGLDVAPHGGSVFIFADIRKSGLSSVEFCTRLLKERQVVTYPGSEFGQVGEGFIRMSLLAPDPKFQEAVGRIQAFVRSL